MSAVRALPTENSTAQLPSTARVAVCASDAVVSAVPELRQFARRAALHWLVPAEAVDALELVVTELATNAVLHSGSDEITLLVSHDGGELTAEVRDRGRWNDAARPEEERTATAEEATSGRGLDLVRYLTKWWLAFTSPLGTRVVACIPAVAD